MLKGLSLQCYFVRNKKQVLGSRISWDSACMFEENSFSVDDKDFGP